MVSRIEGGEESAASAYQKLLAGVNDDDGKSIVSYLRTLWPATLLSFHYHTWTMNIYCCLIFFSEEESEDEIRVEELGSDEEDDEDDDEEEAVDEAFIAVRLCTYLDTPTILR